jgi:DNA-binding transcriptional LysR family regulator
MPTIVRGTEYAELSAFVAVTKERSFRRAPNRLGLLPSALSHTIRELEERLGAKLLNRTTRSIAPTEAGRELYDRLVPAFADIAGALEVVRAFGVRPSGTVRLNLPKLAANMILAPALGRFAREHPQVHLELAVDDGLTDIVASGLDAGIRPGELILRDMVAVRVTPDLRSAVVASPSYLALHPGPQTPRDLKDHVCINYRFAASGALYRWPFAKDGESLDVAVEGSLTLNDMDLVRTAALDGAGLACTLEYSVDEDLASGRLVRLLDDWCQTFPGFFLYYPEQRRISPALRVLIDFLAYKRH